LGEITKSVEYGVTASASSSPVGPKFLRITDIQYGTVDWESVPYCEARARKIVSAKLLDGDIVFARTGATTGKSFLISAPPEDAVFASYLIRVRPSDGLNPRFLAHYFRSNGYWNQIRRKMRGAAQPGVNASVLKSLLVPFPSRREQDRISEILDRAVAIIQKKKLAVAEADSLTRSFFLEMFGDPSVNPNGYEQTQLGNAAQFISGGTPSKRRSEFWDGDFPWVSPKDMKVDLIKDAEDHVADQVFNQTNLRKIPPQTPLIVVRGMILSHTVPIALTCREVAINQDMKAINFVPKIDPVFGYWCIRVQSDRILKLVDTAAHGTKRLDMSRLGSLPIILPESGFQNEFVTIVGRTQDMQARLDSSVAEAKALLAALSQQAFSGEL
jgi:type I restriction enzyme S subunit